MDKIANLLKMLDGVGGEAAEEMRRLLSMPNAVLLTDEPAHPTVHDTLRLWQVRSRINAGRGNKLLGVDALIEALKGLTPSHRKLEQYSFDSGDWGGNVFFNPEDGRLIGYVLGKRKTSGLSMREAVSEAAVA